MLAGDGTGGEDPRGRARGDRCPIHRGDPPFARSEPLLTPSLASIGHVRAVAYGGLPPERPQFGPLTAWVLDPMTTGTARSETDGASKQADIPDSIVPATLHVTRGFLATSNEAKNFNQDDP
jgi:hypothetical protein